MSPATGSASDGRFQLGPRVTRASRVVPYVRTAADPVHRALRIFAFDPSETRLLGNVATVRVPYEPLEPGPCGHLFEVDGSLLDGSGAAAVPLDLDQPVMLLNAGLEPTQSRPQFHMQMTYAVCMGVYERFQTALGRTVAWGFDGAARPERGPFRLRIRPIAEQDWNAYYDPETGELNFGYFEADAEHSIGRNLPGGFVFTSLGHDIVAHECTHALLDGLRAHFNYATHVDVPAFHEGFADIVAVLHRFSHAEVIRKVLATSQGHLEVPVLTGIGKQFGETSGDFGPIRLINDIDPKTGEPPRYSDFTEEHDRGRSLAAAVWDAFTRIYSQKKRKYVLIATGGTGVMPPGVELPSHLLDALVDLARELAGQFLNICIRAIDYCPPVDVRFGDYLRAVITADYDLVPEDPHGYREAWIDAFRRRGIYPQNVSNLGEDALLWQPPSIEIPRRRMLSFAELRFNGDPARSPSAPELQRQAMEVGRLVTAPEYLDAFGLEDHTSAAVRRVVREIDPPCVESVRVARRVGPNGEVGFDLIAEVTQRAVRVLPGRKRPSEVFGGSTLVLDALGNVRYVVRKGLFSERRDQEMSDFIAGRGAAYWTGDADVDRPKRGIARAVHRQRR